MSSSISSLVGYIPSFVLRRVAAGDLTLLEPGLERLHGAVLFVDLRGFTALSEELAALGPLGAERLSAALNPFFDRTIRTLHAHGGDIVCCAGDALLVLWPAGAPHSEDTLAEAAQRAAACGLALQAILEAHATADSAAASPQAPPLRARVGLGAGEVCSLLVGSAERFWNWLVAGEALEQASRAQSLAGTGQVAVAPPVLPLLGLAAETLPLPGDAVRLVALGEAGAPPRRPLAPPVLPDAVLARLMALVPSEVRERLIGDHTAWLAELRQLTVLFVQLPGLDYQSDAVLGRVQRAFLAVQETLSHPGYKGRIIQLSVDDKGTSLLAAFGTSAHEDDASRGVQAALSLRGALSDLGQGCAIGIATGRAFCGERGNTQRWEYGLSGRVVNLAARLMVAALSDPGSVLCDEATAQATRGQVLFETLPPIPLKGYAQKVAIARPLRRQANAGKARQGAVLVGRAAEKAWLADALRRAQDGDGDGAPGRTLIIEGEAGIGKTQLLRSFEADARALGLLVLSSAADAMEQLTPWYAFRGVAAQLLGIDEAPAPGAEARPEPKAELRKERVRARLSLSGMAELAPLLNPLLLTDFPETPETASLSGAARALRLRQIVAALVTEAGRARPVVLLVEDAHWLDTASFALLYELCAGPAAPLSVVTARPPEEPAPPHYAQLLELPQAERRRLGPLSPEEVRALLCQRLGVRALPAAVETLIKERAEGHPFFSEELALALRDAGRVRVQGGECTIAPGVLRLDVPDSMQAAITARIDALPPAEQLLLKVASVVGRNFLASLLGEMFPISGQKGQVPGYLEHLMQRDLVLQALRESEPTYVFKHALTQDTAYNLLLYSQRRALHRRAGELLEARYEELGRTAEVAGILASHFHKGEAWPSALKYHLMAGDAAAQQYAHAEARAHYRDALTVLRELAKETKGDAEATANAQRQADTTVKLVNVSLISQSPQDNIALLAEATRTLAAAGDPETLGEADLLRAASLHYGAGRAYYYFTRPRESQHHFEQMRALTERLGDPDLLAAPTSLIARVVSQRGHFREALRRFAGTFGGLERTSRWSDWTINHAYVGFCQVVTGQRHRGFSRLRSSLAYALRTENQASLPVVYDFITMSHFQAGEHAAAVAAGRQTVEVSLRTGDVLPQHLGHGFAAWSLARLGQMADADAEWQRYDEIVQRMGGRLIYADWFAAARAELALAHGAPDEAVQLADRALALAAKIDGVFATGLALATRGLALAALGDRDAAQDALARSVDRLAETGAAFETARTERAWAALCSAHGDAAAAAELRRRADARLWGTGELRLPAACPGLETGAQASLDAGTARAPDDANHPPRPADAGRPRRSDSQICPLA